MILKHVFIMVLLEGFCSEYWSTTARPKGIDKIFDGVNINNIRKCEH
jgi:hypothetical protein